MNTKKSFTKTLFFFFCAKPFSGRQRYLQIQRVNARKKLTILRFYKFLSSMGLQTRQTEGINWDRDLLYSAKRQYKSRRSQSIDGCSCRFWLSLWLPQPSLLSAILPCASSFLSSQTYFNFSFSVAGF